MIEIYIIIWLIGTLICFKPFVKKSYELSASPFEQTIYLGIGFSYLLGTLITIIWPVFLFFVSFTFS